MPSMWVPEVKERLGSKELMSSVQSVEIIITFGIWKHRARRKSSIRKGLELKKKSWLIWERVWTQLPQNQEVGCIVGRRDKGRSVDGGFNASLEGWRKMVWGQNTGPLARQPSSWGLFSYVETKTLRVDGWVSIIKRFVIKFKRQLNVSGKAIQAELLQVWSTDQHCQHHLELPSDLLSGWGPGICILTSPGGVILKYVTLRSTDPGLNHLWGPFLLLKSNTLNVFYTKPETYKCFDQGA